MDAHRLPKLPRARRILASIANDALQLRRYIFTTLRRPPWRHPCCAAARRKQGIGAANDVNPERRERSLAGGLAGGRAACFPQDYFSSVADRCLPSARFVAAFLQKGVRNQESLFNPSSMSKNTTQES